MKQKKIYMTYKKNIPDKVITRWKKLNPDYQIDLSLDNDCIRFLKNNFNKYVADLFLSINGGMYKADLWRLCKLYKNSGVYADVDLVPYLNIDSLDKDITFYSCLSINVKSIFQAFMVNFSKPKNPLLFVFLLSFLISSILSRKSFSKFFTPNFLAINITPIKQLATFLFISFWSFFNITAVPNLADASCKPRISPSILLA